MHDSPYESSLTHPLGAHESWPRTGPIYDVPASDELEEPSFMSLARLATAAPLDANPSAILPGSLPIWY